VINSAELGYRYRMDSPAQSVGQVRVYHLLGPSDGLAVVLDNDMWQRPLGDVGVAVIWPGLQNRSRGNPYRRRISPSLLTSSAFRCELR